MRQIYTCHEVISQSIDPIRPFVRVAKEDYALFLDSSSKEGRYCVWAWRPLFLARMRGQQLHCTFPSLGEDDHIERTAKPPFSLLDELITWHVESEALLEARAACPFAGAVFGFLSYESGWQFMRQNGRYADQCDDLLFLPGKMVVLDRVTNRTHVLGYGFTKAEAARNLGEATAQCLAQAVGGTNPHFALPVNDDQVSESISMEQYIEKIKTILDYIRAGDIYQANFAYPITQPFTGDPFLLYQILREVNPAPYAAYVHLPDRAILSASPEQFLQWNQSEIQTRPIKGTRPRGETPEKDEILAKELAQSDKEQAELVMIVDLERNDLAKVCETGSIHVPELCKLEAHPTVWHQLATVTGKLKPGTLPSQIFRASFPGGSITGAPKQRAMVIIDELENGPRGIYTGGIGYTGKEAGEWNIAIRTLVIENGQAKLHVGSGIVADSLPEAEFAETLAKGLGILRALAVYEAQFGGDRCYVPMD